jgi:hypothetical protein
MTCSPFDYTCRRCGVGLIDPGDDCGEEQCLDRYARRWAAWQLILFRVHSTGTRVIARVRGR